MLKKKTIAAAIAGAALAAVLGASVSAAFAAEPNGSDGKLYILDAGTGVQVPAGTSLGWNYGVIGSTSNDINEVENATFSCPSDALTARTFISPRGQERTPAQWTAYADNGFKPGTKEILLPSMQLTNNILGNGPGIKTAGGNYSLGIACLKNGNLTVASTGVYYTYISVTAGTGAWTFETPAGVVVPVDPSLTDDINLQATTVAAQDGVLSLEVPANASAVIGNPTLVNQLSVSTGQLGAFTVKDSRVVSHAGWTLTSTVAEFVNGSDSSVKIDAKQLGVKPVIVSTTATGVTASAEQLAGDAVYPAPFAEASNAAQVGDTVLNANLKFVAPANKPAGTYTSKLTLTLASK